MTENSPSSVRFGLAPQGLADALVLVVGEAVLGEDLGGGHW